MTTYSARIRKIETVSGVHPSTDSTSLSTPHYTQADKVRFVNGRPTKIGGWRSVSFDDGNTISGVSRNIFSDTVSGKNYTLIGTNQKLYSVIGTRLTNITPLKTTTVSVANAIATHYDTIGADPLSVTNGSKNIVITDPSYSDYVAGDIITISGATTTGGILDTAINTSHIIRSVGTGTYTITVGTAATSTTTGGGASVVRSSGLISITKASHGMSNGDRVKILAAATTGGITDAQINLEFVIRNVDANTFDVFTAGTATSSVSGGGGASTTYQEEIADGLVDETVATGYGAGLYGIGLYGTGLTSSSARSFPRIWFCDRFGNKLLSTAGNQTGIYEWAGDTSIAPTLITNAPTEVNYAFVSNNILVTLGAGGVENRIFSSDINDYTIWTSSSVNQVFDDDIEGAGRLLCHIPVDDYNLIFTDNKTYKLRYVGQPLIWNIENIDESIGIIAPLAGISVNGVAYWMGSENFYRYKGGYVEIIPSNTSLESTILRYVFDNINTGQKSKCFAWYNKKFNEVWFHYPSASSNECDRVARVNLSTFEWTTDTFDRTAAEFPNVQSIEPRLINSTVLYRHETGTDADGSAMTFSITTNMKSGSNSTSNIVSFIPDNTLSTGSVTVTLTGYQYPQSTAPTYTNTYTVSGTSERVPVQFNARFWKYAISGSTLSQSWRMGDWYEEIDGGARQ